MQQGWGKQQSIVAACHRFGVSDVTRRYTTNYFSAEARRDAVTDSCFSLLCGTLTHSLRGELTAEERSRLQQRDAAEKVQLSVGQRQLPNAELAALPGGLSYPA